MKYYKKRLGSILARCEQIFTLQQIIKKAIAWQNPTFNSLKKVFDSIHRDPVEYC